MKYIQYALVTVADGSPVMRTHQDDSEDPLVNDTISGLLDDVADWADYGMNDILGFMDENWVLKLDDEQYKIVREEVETFDLNERELTALAELKERTVGEGSWLDEG